MNPGYRKVICESENPIMNNVFARGILKQIIDDGLLDSQEVLEERHPRSKYLFVLRLIRYRRFVVLLLPWLVFNSTAEFTILVSVGQANMIRLSPLFALLRGNPRVSFTTHYGESGAVCVLGKSESGWFVRQIN